MKKAICFVFLAAILFGAFVACNVQSGKRDESASSSAAETEEPTETSEKTPGDTETDPAPTTTSPHESAVEEFKKVIHNETDLTWMLKAADPLPALAVSDVYREHVLGVSRNTLRNLVYYGTYNGYDVFRYSTPNQLEFDIGVADACFGMMHQKDFIVYKDEAFCTLYEAYDLGYLSDSDLSILLGYHRQYFQTDYPTWVEGGVTTSPEAEPPSPETTGSPYDEATENYRSVIYNETDLTWMLEEPEPLPELTPLSEDALAAIRALPIDLDTGIWVDSSSIYYGTYNGCDLFLNYAMLSSPQSIYVGSRCYYLRRSFQLVVHKDGKLYSIRDAYYIENLLTDEDLDAIARYHHAHFHRLYEQEIKEINALK